MNLKTICLLVFAFSSALLAMDTTPEYERLKSALATLPEDQSPKDLFIEACGLGYLDLVTGCVSHPDASSFAVDGLTEACAHGRTEVVKMLLQNTSIQFDDNYSSKFVSEAIQHGHVSTVTVLLHDLRIASWTNIWDLLETAIVHKQYEVLKMLTPKADDESIAYIFRLFRFRNDLHAFRILLSTSTLIIPPNAVGEFFSEAVLQDDADMVEKQIKFMGKEFENICLSGPASLGRTEIVKRVLQSPQWTKPINDALLTEASNIDNLELLKVLISDPRLPADHDLSVVLINAIYNGNEEMVKYLLSLQDNRLSAASFNYLLSEAADLKSVIMIRLLLADPRCEVAEFSSDFITHLKQVTKDTADDYFAIDILDKMLSMFDGANENVDNMEKEKYIVGFVVDACGAGNFDVVQTLVERNVIGYSADICFKMACQRGHRDIARLFLDNKLIVADEVANSPKYPSFMRNLSAVKTFVSLEPILKTESLQKLMEKVVFLQDVDLFKYMFEKYSDKLNLPELLRIVINHNSYALYKVIIDHDRSLWDPNDYINLFPLFKNILYVTANEIEKISNPIPFEHLDVLIHHAPRGSKVADYIIQQQLNYIGKRTKFSFNGEDCSYFSGSEKCREHIENEFLPIIQSLYPYLRRLPLMECDLLEKYILSMVALIRSGWTHEQVYVMSDGLGSYKLE